jgi:diguanylate cyclase (GGDEF)-like protein
MITPRRLSPGPSTARSLVLLAAHAQRLQARVTALRAELPQALAGASHAARLLAANEHLVLAALQAQTRAALSLSELQALTQQSQRDTLTRIPNRALMQDRLAQAIAHAARNSALLALFFIDIDSFKQINDAHGHAAGDTVLKTVAARLAACVRQSDTVCRHGGDEFLVLLPELAQPDDALSLADKVMAALMLPCDIGPTLWPLSVSLGLALYPRDAVSAEALTACADRAMYRAKALGGGRVVDGRET